MVSIGTLNLHNDVDMKNGIRKRLTISFSYGAKREDLTEALSLIAQGKLDPQVESGSLEDFPRWLTDLCDGKVKSSVALESS